MESSIIISRRKLFIFVSILAATFLILFFKSKNQPYENDVYIQLDSSVRNNHSNIYYIGNQSLESFTTVITTLFDLKKSKHKQNEYDKWSETMLKSMGAPLVAYVDNFWAEKFIKRCNELNLTGKVFNYYFFLIHLLHLILFFFI